MWLVVLIRRMIATNLVGGFKHFVPVETTNQKSFTSNPDQCQQLTNDSQTLIGQFQLDLLGVSECRWEAIGAIQT